MSEGWIAQRRRYRHYRARTGRLPASYRASIDALERYTSYFGPTKGGPVLSMLEDLADLFEQSAADHIPVRAVVGQDPVEFAEAFLQNHGEGQWIGQERRRLTATIARAAGDQGEVDR